MQAQRARDPNNICTPRGVPQVMMLPRRATSRRGHVDLEMKTATCLIGRRGLYKMSHAVQALQLGLSSLLSDTAFEMTETNHFATPLATATAAIRGGRTHACTAAAGGFAALAGCSAQSCESMLAPRKLHDHLWHHHGQVACVAMQAWQLHRQIAAKSDGLSCESCVPLR
jgi:hypothetical protein